MPISADLLDTVRLSADGIDCTLREYFKQLILTLWREGAGFSGKRPFGNSGWQFGVIHAIVAAGGDVNTPARIDEDGYLDVDDVRVAEDAVRDLIVDHLM